MVDDVPINRLLLRQMLLLECPKAHITEAIHGADALQAMRPINAEDVLLHDGRVDDGRVLGVFCSDKRVDLTPGQILDGVKEILHGYFLC